MRQRAIALLRRVAHWLEGEPADPLFVAAEPLMEAQDLIDGRSGEAKRHQVLAALIKDGHRESEAAMAIERVIQWRQGTRWVRG